MAEPFLVGVLLAVDEHEVLGRVLGETEIDGLIHAAVLGAALFKVDYDGLIVERFAHGEGGHFLARIERAADKPGQGVPVAEHGTDHIAFGQQRGGFLAFPPLAPVVLERQHLRHDFAVQGAVVLPIGLHVPVDVVLFLVELVAREGRKRFLRIQVFPLARRFLDGHAARQAFEQQLAQRLGSAEDGRARHEFGHGGPVCGVPVAHRSPQALDGQVVALLADPAKPVRRAPLQIVMGSPSPKVGEGIVGGVQGQRAEVGGIRGGVAEFDGREVFRKHVNLWLTGCASVGTHGQGETGPVAAQRDP